MRGNFQSQISKNLILKYSQEGEFILAPMIGSGTTLIEAKLLHPNADGIDINPEDIEISERL
ncbi:MAG: hypothetical protein H3C40_05250 [Ignavibacterium sp.]|nr:hypothetical protein [Ignavibacterium sp.]